MDEKPKAWPYGPVFPKTRELDYSTIVDLEADQFKELRADTVKKWYGYKWDGIIQDKFIKKYFCEFFSKNQIVV